MALIPKCGGVCLHVDNVHTVNLWCDHKEVCVTELIQSHWENKWSLSVILES